MRIISGTLKSTPLDWLPILANIESANLRRQSASTKEFIKCRMSENSVLFDVLQDLLGRRLSSRKPPWLNDPELSGNNFDIAQSWRDRWCTSNTTNKHLVADPTIPVSGGCLKRKEWMKLNRLRTGQSRCNYLMHKRNVRTSPLCECGEMQTTSHIVDECPLHKFGGVLALLHTQVKTG